MVLFALVQMRIIVRVWEKGQDEEGQDEEGQDYDSCALHRKMCLWPSAL